jgi:SAM-dependent methyltransferase
MVIDRIMRFAAGLLATTIAVSLPPQAPQDRPLPARKPDVIYYATEPKVIDAMLDLAKVTSRDLVYDLGSGDGRIVIAAAKRGAKAVGIEIDPALVQTATENAKTAGVAGRATFVVGDLFDPSIKIADATVVTLFLLPELNLRLKPRLQRELKAGSRVVSNSFDMGAGWPPAQTTQSGDYTIYLWTIGKSVEGVNFSQRSRGPTPAGCGLGIQAPSAAGSGLPFIVRVSCPRALEKS